MENSFYFLYYLFLSSNDLQDFFYFCLMLKLIVRGHNKTKLILTKFWQTIFPITPEELSWYFCSVILAFYIVVFLFCLHNMNENHLFSQMYFSTKVKVLKRYFFLIFISPNVFFLKKINFWRLTDIWDISLLCPVFDHITFGDPALDRVLSFKTKSFLIHVKVVWNCATTIVLVVELCLVA